MKTTIYLIVLLFTITVVSAQKKVAVFDPTDDNKSEMAEIVREVLSTGLTNTPEYVPVERALIKQVLKENKYQSSGMVDESKISELGKQMGADYVCISIIKKMGSNYFITAKLVDVTTATVILQKYVNTENGTNDFFEKTEELSGKLFGERSSTTNTKNKKKIKDFSKNIFKGKKNKKIKTDNNSENSNTLTDNKKQESLEKMLGSFIDQRDKKKYRTIKIGTQVWMAENLAYNSANGCWVYNYEASNTEKYGYLYNFETAQNVCPNRFHLPSDSEWEELAEYVNKADITVSKLKKGDWKNLGKNLKSKTGWEEGENGTDKYGFSAMPGGSKGKRFNSIGKYGSWWSSTSEGKSKVLTRRILNNNDIFYKIAEDKELGFSVRCLKD